MASFTHRVNYDLIAHLYDEPGRDYDIDANLINFLKEKREHLSTDISILDMGCGTGKQLTADQEKFPGVQMVGLDLFHGMLEQARKRCAMVQWIQGDSAHPPFADCSFDYITNQFSYHHIKNKIGMISEIYRILKPGGRFAMTNLDPWSMPEWIVYTFFPTSKQRDLEDFLPVDELISLMNKTGFCNVRVKYQHKKSEENLNEFLNYALQRHRTSQLIVISDEEYENGIARLQEYVSERGNKASVSSEISLVWLMGDKAE